MSMVKVKEQETSIVEYSQTEAALSDLRARYKGAIYGVETHNGLIEAKKARSEIRSIRIALENKRVEIKEPALARCQLIDAEARRITRELTALEDPIDLQIKNEEQFREDARMAVERAEAKRIAYEQAAIKAAEEAQLAAERAEIARRQAELDAAEKAARDKIEAADRAARLEREKADREAALAREEADRKVREERARQDTIEEARRAQERKEREAAEAKLKAERDKIEVDRRALEQKQREETARVEAKVRASLAAQEAKAKAARDAEEAKQREAQRKQSEALDARALLTSFVARFGHIAEFAAVVKAIDAVMKKSK